MRASRPGEVASFSSVDTPPSRNRVMFLTGIPCARATSEWPSSWASTDTNSRMVATAATIQASAGLQEL
jgi:hypothetical protein